MTIYYEGAFARITDEAFESRIPGGQTFAIRELAHPHAVRRTLTGRTTIGLLATAGMVSASVAIGGATGSPGLGAAVAALLSVLAMLTWFVVARRRPLELRALYRGSVVTLLSTRDPLVLGQVSRALLRVIELDDSDDALGGDWAIVH